MVSDPLKLQLHVVVSHPVRCWELNSGPMQELHMLFTAEPSLPPLKQLSKHSLVVTYAQHKIQNFQMCSSRAPVHSQGCPATTSVCLPSRRLTSKENPTPTNNGSTTLPLAPGNHLSAFCLCPFLFRTFYTNGILQHVTFGSGFSTGNLFSRFIPIIAPGTELHSFVNLNKA